MFYHVEYVLTFWCRCSGSDGLSLHLLWLADDLVRSTLNDTASLGELSANAHEVGIDVTSSLATFIDAPAIH